MNIIIIMDFSNIISLLFLRNRGIKFKIHDCVVSDLLCTKHEAPKICFDAQSTLLEKTIACDVSFLHALLCNANKCQRAVFYG